MWDFGLDSLDSLGGLHDDWLGLFSLLVCLDPSQNAGDLVVWWHNQNGFSVKNGFCRLYGLNSMSILLDSDRLLTFSSLWEVKVPNKVKVLGWCFILNNLPLK